MSGNDKDEKCGERREYFRIEDRVVLDCEPIGEEGMSLLRERLDGRVPDRFSVAASFATHSRAMNHLLNGFSGRSAELDRYLRMMDQKLNQLARLFIIEEMDMANRPVLDVNLSAGGLVFPSSDFYDPGQLLQLRLVLLPELLGILVGARVVYCDKAVPGSAEYPWQVAVEYDCIRESDRDLLCSHIMARQTEQRRQQREAEMQETEGRRQETGDK